MSGTYRYVVSETVCDETVDRIATMSSSQAAWNAYLMEYWGEVRYPHDVLVADATSRRGSSPGSYYLAHSLVVNRPAVPTFFVGVQLDALLLDFEWLPRELAVPDEEARLLIEARRRCGFRSVRERRAGIDPFTGQPMTFPPRASRFPPMHSEDELRAAFGSAGLSDVVAHDLLLINRLCNRQNPRAADPTMAYPVRALHAWDNYEGYLTGAELLTLQPPETDGFLSAFRRAAAAAGAEAPHQVRSVDVVVQARAS